MYFGNSAFLWALLVLAIPIIIHLVRLRRLKVIKFPSFKFLRKTAEQGARPKKLMRYLILAARCLAFGCLVLAFTLPSCNNQYQKVSKSLIGIYFDNSLSMSGHGGDPLVFKQNKEYVRSLIRKLPSSAEIKFITQSGFGGVSNSLSISQAEEMLDEIKPSNLSESMEVLLRRLTHSMEKESGANKEIYIISDFQKGTLGNLSKQNFKNIKINALSVPMDDVSNVSIDSAWIENPVLLKGESITIDFIVNNRSNQSVKDLPIKLITDNVQLGLQSYSIPPNSIKKGFFIIPYSQNFSNLKIELKDKGFAFDNTLYINPGPAPKLGVAQVGVNNTYISKVLNSQEMFVSSTGEPDRIICDQCSESIMQSKILPYLKEGGTALISLPSSGVSPSLAKLLGVKELKLKTGEFGISAKSLSHSFYTSVFTSTPKNLVLPTVTSYYSTGGNTGYGDPILTLQNGDAFFLRLKKGKGTLYVSMAPFNASYSNWVASSIFLPTITQALLPTSSKGNLYGFISDDQPIKLHVDLKEADEGVYAIKNEGFQNKASISNGFSGAELHTGNYLEQPGTYDLINTKTKQTIDRLAININRKESEAVAESKAAIQKALPNIKWFSLKNKEDNTASYASLEHQGGLWRLFIWLAAAFFAVEMVLIFLRQKINYTAPS